MDMIRKLLHFVQKLYYTSNEQRYIKYLRSGGVKVGKNVRFRYPRHTLIDVSRPALVTIGDDVDINNHFQIMAHDWVNHVFMNKFHDFINATGKVTIGNNIYFGTNVIVLMGVTIGDNCIIGAGSIVTHDIPSNTVAAGNPCRVICSIEDFYRKRKAQGLGFAKEYVSCIRQRFGRDPYPEEMKEEFIYYVGKHNIGEYPNLPIKWQLGDYFDKWLALHKPPYSSFEDFLNNV